MPASKKVKEWVIDTTPDSCDCSLIPKLKPTGYADNQCASYYCPICHIGFWLCEVKPTLNQVQEAKKINADITEKDMIYHVFKRTPKGKWGSNPETVMIDQFGKCMPYWLTQKQKDYWMKKYCERYPNSVKAKAWKEKNKK